MKYVTVKTAGHYSHSYQASSCLCWTNKLVVRGVTRSIFDCSCIVILDSAKFFEGVKFFAAMELLYAAYYCTHTSKAMAHGLLELRAKKVLVRGN